MALLVSLLRTVQKNENKGRTFHTCIFSDHIDGKNTNTVTDNSGKYKLTVQEALTV